MCCIWPFSTKKTATVAPAPPPLKPPTPRVPPPLKKLVPLAATVTPPKIELPNSAPSSPSFKDKKQNQELTKPQELTVTNPQVPAVIRFAKPLPDPTPDSIQSSRLIIQQLMLRKEAPGLQLASPTLTASPSWNRATAFHAKSKASRVDPIPECRDEYVLIADGDMDRCINLIERMIKLGFKHDHFIITHQTNTTLKMLAEYNFQLIFLDMDNLVAKEIINRYYAKENNKGQFILLSNDTKVNVEKFVDSIRHIKYYLSNNFDEEEFILTLRNVGLDDLPKLTDFIKIP